MTMVEGESLAKVLDTDSMFKQGPRMPLAQTLEVFTKVVETMAHVHERGVLHLDIKPENIMVGRHGEVFVMDWGNARLFNPEPYQEYLRKFAGDMKVEPVDPERRNVVIGTPLYMSPEQTNTPRDLLTPGSDIFSAGAVFYEMLTGKRAFQADTSEEAMERVRTLSVPLVHELNPEVPVRLSAICARMLAKPVYDRYRSFDEVLAELTKLRDSGQAFATRTYEAGQVIFREGDPGEYAFTIVSGRVEIAAGGDGGRTVLAALGPGEIVGELAIFTDHPRTATATALESTTIRIMSAADVKTELEKLRPWVGAMIRGLSERFIGLNEKLMKRDGA
jgi:serine/threonine-protein kinase